MSAHSGFSWKEGDPITDELVKEVAECTQANYGWACGGFQPGCYAIITPVDDLIYNFGKVLDKWDQEKDFKEHVQGFEGVPDWFVDLAVRALPLMKLPKKRAKTEEKCWAEQFVDAAMQRMADRFSKPPVPIMSQEEFDALPKGEKTFLYCNVIGCGRMVCTHGMLCLEHHTGQEGILQTDGSMYRMPYKVPDVKKEYPPL